MTIYEIKERTQTTSPYFFEHKTLKFFHQTMKSFKVYKWKEGKFLIQSPMRDNQYKVVGYTQRLFNPKTNELEHFQK